MSRTLCASLALVLMQPLIGLADDSEKLVAGEWQVFFAGVQYKVYKSDEGESLTVDLDIRIEIRDRRMTVFYGKNSFTWKVDRISLEEGKVGEIDLAGETVSKPVQKGLIMLKDGVLTFRIPTSGGDRPSSFEVKPNETGILLAARRKK
jgi:hypothetical protein